MICGGYLGEAGSGDETSGGGAEETKVEDDKAITQTQEVMEMEHCNDHDVSVAEWAHEIEMQRLLDELITMTGSVKGGELLEVGDTDTGLTCGPVDYANTPDLESAMDIGVGLDIQLPTFMDWGLDSAVGSLDVF